MQSKNTYHVPETPCLIGPGIRSTELSKPRTLVVCTCQIHDIFVPPVGFEPTMSNHLHQCIKSNLIKISRPTWIRTKNNGLKVRDFTIETTDPN